MSSGRYDTLTEKLEPDEALRQAKYYDTGEITSDLVREWAYEHGEGD